MVEPAVEEVARSLCALGRTVSSSSDDDTSTKFMTVGQRPCAVAGSVSSMALGFTECDQQVPSTTITSTGKKLKKKVTTRKATNLKGMRSHQHPYRDFSIPLDEMERLMRVYGSIKCLRNRTPETSGRSTKVESVKRKFYRWFPDLDERFVRTDEGWYMPKAGHDEEIQYREAMRKGDQDCLVKKRNTRRYGSKQNVDPAV